MNQKEKMQELIKQKQNKTKIFGEKGETEPKNRRSQMRKGPKIFNS